jgi:hypothetical protein
MTVQRWFLGAMRMQDAWWPIALRGEQDFEEARQICNDALERPDVEAVQIVGYRAGLDDSVGVEFATWHRERGDELWREERRP